MKLKLNAPRLNTATIPRRKRYLPLRTSLIPSRNLNSLVEAPTISLTPKIMINNAMVPGNRESQNTSLTVHPRNTMTPVAVKGPMIAPV